MNITKMGVLRYVIKGNDGMMEQKIDTMEVKRQGTNERRSNHEMV